MNRCGVIAGPWQMGKVDQGVFTYWLLAHHFGRPLEYFGFGGAGKQVRDLLHVADLVDLLDEQLCEPERWDGVTVNVGGGRECSLSLRETTELCRELTGREVEVGTGSRGPATSRSTCPTPAVSTRSPTGGRAATPVRYSPTSWPGSRHTRTRSESPWASTERVKLSVVIPAHDEAESIAETLRGLAETLDAGVDRL